MGKSDLSEWGMKGIIRFRLFWIILLLALCVPAYFGAKRVRMDSSNESFMPENDPLTLKNDEFKEIFGNEEFFYILVEADDLFSEESMERILQLEEDIKQNLPFVDDVTSVVSAESMEASDGFLNVESLKDKGFPDTEEGWEKIRKQWNSSLIFRNRLISESGDSVSILVNMNKIPDKVYARTQPDYSPYKERYVTRERAVMSDDISETPGTDGYWMQLEDPRKDVAASLYAILADYNTNVFQLKVTGLPIIDYGSDKLTGDESVLFGILSLTAAALLLLLLFRNLRSLLAPLSVFFLTILYLFGLMGWTNMNFSLMTIILIPLLLVISVSYSIHIINQIRKALNQGQSRMEAIRAAYSMSSWPCFLTAVTTAAGFVSFLFVPMAPIRQLGLQCALGTMLSFFLVMILVPILFLPGKEGVKKDEVIEGHKEIWLKWTGFLNRRKVIITLGTLLITGLSVWGAFRIKPSMMEMIGDNTGFVEDANYISDRLGGAYSAEILITLPEPDMAKDPNVLRALQQAGKLASRYDDMKMSLSLADLVLELDRVFEEKTPEEASIPDSREAVAQYLLLYEWGGGESLEDWTDFDYQILRMTILYGAGTDSYKALENEIVPYLRENLPAGTEVSLAGDLPVLMRMMELLTLGQVKSCLAALLFICLLLIIILRSFRLGGLAIIPNLFPIIVTLGTMGFLNFSLDFVTAMVAPMLIGIAVDDTVHFFIHYKKIKTGKNISPWESSGKTFLSIGNALVFTSVVLTGGFVLFSFSRMASLRHLGILASVGIVSALFADLCLSPLLLGRFDRKNIVPGGTKWKSKSSLSLS